MLKLAWATTALAMQHKTNQAEKEEQDEEEATARKRRKVTRASGALGLRPSRLLLSSFLSSRLDSNFAENKQEAVRRRRSKSACNWHVPAMARKKAKACPDCSMPEPLHQNAKRIQGPSHLESEGKNQTATATTLYSVLNKKRKLAQPNERLFSSTSDTTGSLSSIRACLLCQQHYTLFTVVRAPVRVPSNSGPRPFLVQLLFVHRSSTTGEERE